MKRIITIFIVAAVAAIFLTACEKYVYFIV
jgi:predicted small secreted protein